MFNLEAINSNAIAYSPVQTAIIQDVIAFDGYGLQNNRIVTSYNDGDNLTEVDLRSFNYPRDDGGSVLSKFYRGRDINLEITLKEQTAEAFAVLLDEFKKSLRKTEGNLDVFVNGETRRIKATCTKIDFNRKHYNVTYITAKVTFRTLEPHFYAENPQTYRLQAQSGSFFAETTNEGSGESSPTFYFIFWAWSTTTQLQINAFGLSLTTVGSSFANNDVLIVDCKNKSVTKNGNEIDYIGQFPKFPPGSCPFQIAITGASLIDLTTIVPKIYL